MTSVCALHSSTAFWLRRTMLNSAVLHGMICSAACGMTPAPAAVAVEASQCLTSYSSTKTLHCENYHQQLAAFSYPNQTTAQHSSCQ